jgi:hypothetical protein
MGKSIHRGTTLWEGPDRDDIPTTTIFGTVDVVVVVVVVDELIVFFVVVAHSSAVVVDAMVAVCLL